MPNLPGVAAGLPAPRNIISDQVYTREACASSFIVATALDPVDKGDVSDGGFGVGWSGLARWTNGLLPHP
jgi:hypothetical protein